MKQYRLGVIPYLNVKPLIYDFEQNPHPDVALIWGVPAELIGRLRAGELDAAIVSSIASLEDDGLAIVPGCGIAARGAVDSIRLFCRKKPQEVRRVALDGSSRTAATLTRILLPECFGVEPEYVVMPPHLDNMLAEADAALLIGDPAMRAYHRGGYPEGIQALDLGEVWQQLTGLPFVYAVWTSPRGLDTAPIAAILAEAREAAQPHLDTMADAAAARLELPVAVCRNYLRNIMVYELGPEEFRGLRRFGELAARHGLIAAAG